jgi:Glycosyl transferases group 1/Glycosyl transferase family 2/Glycosyltransferase Family 4
VRGRIAHFGGTDAGPAVAPGPIVFASYSGIWGGAERALLDVIEAVTAPSILLCPEGPLAERARAAGTPVLVRPERAFEMRGGLGSRAAAAFRLGAHAAEIRALVGTMKPRAVVAWNMRSGIAAAIALRLHDRRHRRTPLIFQQSDLLPAGVTAAVVRLAAGAADCVIVNSSAVASDLGARGRCVVVHPGIDVDAYVPRPLPPGPPQVLTLGAIAPSKRPDLALEAVALACRELPELRLVVAGHLVDRGGAALLRALRERATKPDLAGRVDFVGHLPDPREAFAQSWCLLHCAEREAFGLVVVEAMASGRPVVAPASGGPAEIVEPGVGLLYPPGDAGAAARALVALLSDRERVRMAGEHARRRAEGFRREESARRWRSAASSVLPRRRIPQPHGDQAIGIVTVTYDSAAPLTRLLRSVARCLPHATVLVIDSDSNDGSASVARAWPGGATVIELGADAGCAGAANAAVAAIDAAACVLLRPDVQLVDESLLYLGAEATRSGTPDRLLAPVVLGPGGTPEPLRRRRKLWLGDAPRRVAFEDMYCLCARTETLLRLGPFDDQSLVPDTDRELGLRARDAGVETWWWPTARVIRGDAQQSREPSRERPRRVELSH